MNNAIYGKTMENVRNHVDVKLIIKWEGCNSAEAMIAKPNFYSRSVFAENFIEMRKLEMKFDKPWVYTYSYSTYRKCLYEFHHEYMSTCSPWVHVTDVLQQMQDYVHQHGQSHVPYRMWRCL